MHEKPKQTFCPYTRTKLGESGPTNREHVTPVAIGAPNKFWVASHESGNANWNNIVDGPFSNEGIIRFLAMANNVESRSGDVKFRTPATILETHDSVNLELGDSIGIHFKQPVEKTSDLSYIVRGYGEEAFKRTDDLKKSLEKKGFITKSCQYNTIDNPTIEVTLDPNPRSDLLHLQLIKTAYLYTVWCLGDIAIRTSNSDQYLSGLNGHDIQQADLELSEHKEGYHQFTLFVLGNKSICEVNLFGVYKTTFATDLQHPFDRFAQYSCIDLRNRIFSEEINSAAVWKSIAQRIL